ncbi:DedA family protein [Rheinheimera texasensis]|uniref:DedA family protein n=1 Tax=Rheinheimera texasensis TaxID=306205 RepID=UPI0032B2D24F
MQEMLMAIWHQNFDQLIQLGKVDLLIWCLLLILFLESAFVFLPLPGDSLVLMAGGLMAAKVIEPEVVYLYMPLAAGLGSLLAYWQGYALAHTRFMHLIGRIVPDNSLPRATSLLERHGLLAMFSSRFIPFVRVLTPMMMGMTRLTFLHVTMISLVSAWCWTFVLSLASETLMKLPFLMQYHQLLGKGLVLVSLGLFVLAILAIVYRLMRKPAAPAGE